MPADNRAILLRHLNESHQTIEELLPAIDPSKEIYPGWTIKQILAHISGWDDACIDALRLHELDHSPSTPAIHSLDKYNEFSISSRKGLTYDQILKEWRGTRKILCEIIEGLTEEKFLEPVPVPWGKKTTVTRLADIFSHHDNEHAKDIIEWLKNPEKPLRKAGK
jgi:hypothetical protein